MAEVGRVATVRFGLDGTPTPVDRARADLGVGTATLTVAQDATGEPIAFGLALSDPDLPSIAGARIRVGFDTTAVALSAFQLGLFDPVVVSMYAGLLADTDELALAAAAIEQAHATGSVRFDSLPPEVVAALADLPTAAAREAAALAAASTESDPSEAGGILPSDAAMPGGLVLDLVTIRSVPGIAGDEREAPRAAPNSRTGRCLTSAGSAEKAGVCIEEISQRSDGTYTIRGTNSTPRWISIYDLGTGTPRFVDLIPPKIWQLPSILELFGDVLYDMSASAVTALKRGMSFLTEKVFRFDNDWGEDDPELLDRIGSRLRGYVGPAPFSITVPLEGSPRVGLLTGAPGILPTELSNIGGQDLPAFLTLMTAAFIPALQIVSGLPRTQYNRTAATGQDEIWRALGTDAGPLLAGYFDTTMTFLDGDFVDVMGRLPRLAQDTWMFATNKKVARFMIERLGFDPTTIGSAALQYASEFVAVGAAKLIDTSVDLANAAMTLWELHKTTGWQAAGAVVTLASLPPAPPAPATSANTTVPVTAPPVTSLLPTELESLVTGCNDYVPDWYANGNHAECEEGEWVARLQQALTAWELGVNIPLDGRLGPDTQRALLLWQHQRSWPEPGLQVNKDDLLGVQVFSILDDPGVSRTATCPKWIPRDLAVEVGNDIYDRTRMEPLLQLCHRGGDVENIQAMLTILGFTVDVDGYYGLGTYEAVRAWKTSIGTAPSADDGSIWVSDYGLLLGD